MTGVQTCALPIYDPRQNIFGGVRYLRWLLDKFAGDMTLASAGYNAGENAVVRYGGIPPYKETQYYVRKVMAILEGGGAAAPEAEPATVTMASYTPGGPAVGGQSARAPRAATGKTRAVVRTLYRWKDARGVMHMTETPPAEGEYVTVRTAD